MWIVELFLIATFGFSMNVMETDHAFVIYPDGFEERAVELAGVLENIRGDIVEDFGNDPGKITVTLLDGGTHTNGFTDVVTRSITILTWGRPSVWLNFSDWYRTVTRHELTHMVHITSESGINRFITNLTGIPLLNPHVREPFLEAVTLFEESRDSIHSGRLNNPFLTKALVGSFKSSWGYSLPSIVVPPPGWFMAWKAHYVIPASFLDRLVEEHGWEKFEEFLKRSSSRIFGIGYTGDFKSVYGFDLNEAYSEWSVDVPGWFPKGHEVLVEIENTAVSKLRVFKNEVYFSGVKYDSRVPYFIGVLKNGGFEILVESRIPITDFFVTEDGIYYATVIPVEILNPSLWKTLTSIEFLKRGSLRSEVIRAGCISAFAVSNGEVYWSEYDPRGDVSTVYRSGKEVFKIRGMVREMTVSDGGIYTLVSREGRSSDIIFWNGRLSVVGEDERFKYSLKPCGKGVCFLMMDGNTDLYRLEGGFLKRLTEGLVANEAVLKGDRVVFSSFSRNFPGMGMYTVRSIEKDATFSKPDEKRVFKGASVRRIDPVTFYAQDFTVPDIRLPLILYDGTSLTLGAVFAEVSPGYRFGYALAPFYDLKRGFGYGVYVAATLPLNVEFNAWALDARGIFGLESSGYVSLSWTGSPYHVNPWTILGVGGGIWLKSPFDYGLSADVDVSVGYVDSSLSISHSLDKGEGHLRFRTSVPAFGAVLESDVSISYPSFEGSVGLHVLSRPLKVDIGILDPYFHVGNLSFGAGTVFSDVIWFEVFLDLDFSEFLTVVRNRLRMGISISERGVEPVVNVRF